MARFIDCLARFCCAGPGSLLPLLRAFCRVSGRDRKRPRLSPARRRSDNLSLARHNTRLAKDEVHLQCAPKASGKITGRRYQRRARLPGSSGSSSSRSESRSRCALCSFPWAASTQHLDAEPLRHLDRVVVFYEAQSAVTRAPYVIAAIAVKSVSSVARVSIS